MLTSAHVQSLPPFAMRRCNAPPSSVHAFDEEYSFTPPWLLGISRTCHSYPLNGIVLEGGVFCRSTTETATISGPAVGRASKKGGGRYPGSISRAAYSVPRCVALLHLKFACTRVNGWPTKVAPTTFRSSRITLTAARAGLLGSLLQ